MIYFKFLFQQNFQLAYDAKVKKSVIHFVSCLSAFLSLMDLICFECVRITHIRDTKVLKIEIQNLLIDSMQTFRQICVGNWSHIAAFCELLVEKVSI